MFVCNLYLQEKSLSLYGDIIMMAIEFEKRDRLILTQQSQNETRMDETGCVFKSLLSVLLLKVSSLPSLLYILL